MFTVCSCKRLKEFFVGQKINMLAFIGLTYFVYHCRMVPTTWTGMHLENVLGLIFFFYVRTNNEKIVIEYALNGSLQFVYNSPTHLRPISRAAPLALLEKER